MTKRQFEICSIFDICILIHKMKNYCIVCVDILVDYRGSGTVTGWKWRLLRCRGRIVFRFGFAVQLYRILFLKFSFLAVCGKSLLNCWISLWMEFSSTCWFFVVAAPQEHLLAISFWFYIWLTYFCGLILLKFSLASNRNI